MLSAPPPPPPPSPIEVQYRVLVPASDRDRAAHVVSFRLRGDVPPEASLQDAKGRPIPLQTDADGSATFIIPWQSAGEPLDYILTGPAEAGPSAHPPGIATVRTSEGIRFEAHANQPIFVYRTERDAPLRAGIAPMFQRAGYLHPVFTPGGRRVTEDAPLNHPHHHGIWFAWSRTVFQGRTPNFWEQAQQSGRVDLQGAPETWSGTVHAGLRARLHLVDLSGPVETPAIAQELTVTTYGTAGITPALYVVDLVNRETCATKEPVILAEHRYGGFGYRGPDEWDGTNNLVVLTSEGNTERRQVDRSRVRWCYLTGASGPSQGGILVLGHPANRRTPEPVRLHPQMPFLSFAPTQIGEINLAPGDTLVSRYRVITLDTPPDPVFFEALWAGYAYPATATVERHPPR